MEWKRLDLHYEEFKFWQFGWRQAVLLSQTVHTRQPGNAWWLPPSLATPDSWPDPAWPPEFVPPSGTLVEMKYFFARVSCLLLSCILLLGSQGCGMPGNVDFWNRVLSFHLCPAVLNWLDANVLSSSHFYSFAPWSNQSLFYTLHNTDDDGMNIFGKADSSRIQLMSSQTGCRFPSYKVNHDGGEPRGK